MSNGDCVPKRDECHGLPEVDEILTISTLSKGELDFTQLHCQNEVEEDIIFGGLRWVRTIQFILL